MTGTQADCTDDCIQGVAGSKVLQLDILQKLCFPVLGGFSSMSFAKLFWEQLATSSSMFDVEAHPLAWPIKCPLGPLALDSRGRNSPTCAASVMRASEAKISAPRIKGGEWGRVALDH